MSIQELVPLTNDGNERNDADIQDEMQKILAKKELINYLPILWENWLNCYIEITAKERFIISYLDPRYAAECSENLEENKTNLQSVEESFREITDLNPELISLLNNAFGQMIKNPDLLFLIGGKITRISMENRKRKYSESKMNSEDNEIPAKCMKL